MERAVLTAVAELVLREARVRRQPRKVRTQTYTNKVHGIDKKTRTHADMMDELEKIGHAGDGAAACKVKEAELSSSARNDLPASAFVFPKDRRYPIHDLSHARNALARASGKPEEGAVKAAVYRKYPQLKGD